MLKRLTTQTAGTKLPTRKQQLILSKANLIVYILFPYTKNKIIHI